MHPLVGIVLACATLATISQANDHEKQIATLLCKKLTVEFLEDREFEIEEDELEVTAQAVEPKKEVEVEIDEMAVTGNRATATLIVKAPFAIKGTIEHEDAKVKVSGVVDLALEIDVAAEVRQLGDDITIRVRAEEIECEVDKIREQEPPELSGARELIEAGFRHYEEDLREELNEWLEENEIDPRKVDE